MTSSAAPAELLAKIPPSNAVLVSHPHPLVCGVVLPENSERLRRQQDELALTIVKCENPSVPIIYKL